MMNILKSDGTSTKDLWANVRHGLHSGGPWLVAVRSWIQRKVQNGEHVLWGSNDILGGFDKTRIDSHRPFSVKDLENIATEVAQAAYMDCYSNLMFEMRHAALDAELKQLPDDARVLRRAIEILFG